MHTETIGFIGGGNMAAALIGGLIADGMPPERLLVADPDPEKGKALASRFGITLVESNGEAADRADVLVLAVKPQQLQSVAREMAPSLSSPGGPLLISIAAGIRTDTLLSWLGDVRLAVVRTMPNTPAMIQVGATALFAASGVSAAQRDTAEQIMRAVGVVIWVDDEALMDAVTAVSGSGPAYYFLIMEAMEAAAIELGLPADAAHLLTLQTALGAARMALESPDDPATLRTKVTSPGGTTEAALQRLEDGGLRSLISDALKAAHDRSVELSNSLDSTDG